MAVYVHAMRNCMRALILRLIRKVTVTCVPYSHVQNKFYYFG